MSELTKKIPEIAGYNKLRPAGDRLLVQLLAIGEETTAGGLVLPDKVKEQGPRIALVLSVGQGFKSAETGRIEPGDLVVINRHAGLELTTIFPGVPLRIINTSEVIGFCTPEDIEERD